MTDSLVWLFQDVPDYWAGISLAALAVILGVFGLATIVQALDTRNALPWYSRHRWFPGTYSWWIGWTMIGVGIIMALIGVGVISDGHGSPLWGVALCVLTGFCAVRAFGMWSTERLPRWGNSPW